MNIYTAFDMVGLQSRPKGRWVYEALCPWCGEDAWFSDDYFQCANPSCTKQVASPEDIVAEHYGGYEQAGQVILRRTSNLAAEEESKKRAVDRMVMDLWLEFCISQPSGESVRLTNRYDNRGFGVRQSRFNAIVLDSRQMKRLVEMAELTGASFPDSWRDSAPGAALCFCIQSNPHTIDRIAVLGRGERTQEIVWNRYAAGFCGLIGLSPNRPRLLVADALLALRLQKKLADNGVSEEICSVYSDEWGGSTCPTWKVNTHLLTAATRTALPMSDPLLFSSSDLPTIQFAMDHFKGLASRIRAVPIGNVLDLGPRDIHYAWKHVRWAGIVELIHDHDTQMPPTAQAMFEKTGTRPEDAARMIAHFQKKGRMALAEDIARSALTRIVYRDQRVTVKETSNDYQIHSQGSVSTLANFSLRVNASVSFDEVGEAYCQAQLRCGRAVMDVLFQQNLLHDRVNSLEEELKRQISGNKKTTTAGKLPTIIDSNKFRTYIMKDLKEQVAEAELIAGIDRLGWSSDRKSFNFPGFTVDIHGQHKASKFLCPSIPVLKLFKASPDWAEVCPSGMDRSCHDIVSMMVASCVRYYRRCATHPITVVQTSDSSLILDRIMGGMGQSQVHELNSNIRDGARIAGVYGYPILAAGPVLAAKDSSIPFFLLTNSGYSPPTSPTVEQISAAARAAQFSMMRVVEWCIATGADEFKEIRSVQHHRSLMREGQWLMQHVCELQEWEISTPEPTALDKLLEQIPYEEAGRRMTLIGGDELVIDIHDLSPDQDSIVREGKNLGTIIAIDGDKIMSTAAKLVPAISNYYGQEPDFTMVVP